jgi:hypothetical protein
LHKVFAKLSLVNKIVAKEPDFCSLDFIVEVFSGERDTKAQHGAMFIEISEN